MGDGHDRPRKLRDDRFEPGATVGVEVRLRLVEQQQVGLADQACGERDELALPAAERRGRQGRDRRRRTRGRRASPSPRRRVPHRPPRTHRSSSACWRMSTRSMRARSVTTSGTGELDLHGAHLGVERGHVGTRGEHRLLGRAIVTVGVLLEVGDHEILAAHDLAGRRQLVPLQQPQQRGLAGAVGSDDADARTLGHLEVDPPQHRPGAVRLLDVHEADDGHGDHDTEARRGRELRRSRGSTPREHLGHQFAERDGTRFRVEPPVAWRRDARATRRRASRTTRCRGCGPSRSCATGRRLRT